MGRREGTLVKGLATKRDRALGSDVLARVFRIVLVAAVYYVAARLSLRLALVESNVTPLWPPTGIALVAFLVLGRGMWPGIAIAAFLVNAPISTNTLAAAATAAGNTLAPLVAAELLLLVGFRNEIDRVRDALAIVFLAALSATLLSASIGAGTLVLSDAIPASQFWSAWSVWWTGDAMGILVVAPFLLSLLLPREGSRPNWARRAEAAALFVAVVAVSLAVAHAHLQLLFLLLPVLGWAAWRFQLRGSAPAALLVAGIATWAAAHDWGPFAAGSLFEKMVTLQAFNATAAFTSFFFAALVTERVRAGEALERAASNLEDRVRQRTVELSTANDQLTREISEREEAERRLRQQERQLAEAQQVARVGSWEWLIPEDRVTWSDEMYRIHGYQPQEFPVTFEKAIEQVVPGDLERIRRNVGAALRGGSDQSLSPNEYRIVRTDGAERVFRGKAKLEVGPAGGPVRMIGTVQDITEEKQAEREHRIAETLQRSLLPDQLPEIPGVQVAARYVPASTGMEVGGDWYDVVPLSGGQVGVAIGDVAGHGLRAAGTMGQLRMALRAYALQERSPVQVMARVRELVQRLVPTEMATLVYIVYDPDSGSITFSNAGHLPPLLIHENGEASYLEQALAPPLGAAPHPDYDVEASAEVPAGSTLLLFTDGLVERRGVSLRHGLARLKEEALASDQDLEALCDHLLAAFLEKEVSDDVALLALRPIRFSGEPLHLRAPAERHVLAGLRHTVRRWLRETDASPQEVYEILVACGEACANAIEHPYAAGGGFIEIEVAHVDDEVHVTVRDSGTWRHSSPPDGGHGMKLIRELMDNVEVSRGPSGSAVRMRRRLGRSDHDE
jgi:PAS domain S-box-containing protein